MAALRTGLRRGDDRRRSPVTPLLGAPWLGAVVVLASKGGRRGRRAALRGLLCTAAAEVVTHAVAPGSTTGSTSGATRRAAPRFARRGRGGVVPAAAAFGFSAGVAQEWPVAAPALVPAAAATAWMSGRRRGAGGLEVAAGSLLGVAMGLASRRAWRVAPSEAAAARPVWTSLRTEPSADGAGLAVLVNPSSGPAWSPDPTDALREALPAARVERLEEGDDLG